MEFVLPHSQLWVSLTTSSCCNGRYGWKNASYRENGTVSLKDVRIFSKQRTFPKISRGRPIYAIILLWSEVRRDVGRDKVGARAANGGDPQSSNVCNRPSIIYQPLAKKLR